MTTLLGWCSIYGLSRTSGRQVTRQSVGFHDHANTSQPAAESYRKEVKKAYTYDTANAYMYCQANAYNIHVHVLLC